MSLYRSAGLYRIQYFIERLSVPLHRTAQRSVKPDLVLGKIGPQATGLFDTQLRQLVVVICRK